jgi:hypothetical protein
LQRKVFRIGGELALATRDGALFETAGTLARLIAQGGQQRRDLAEWEAAVPVPAAEPPPPLPPRSVVAATRPPASARMVRPRREPLGERWLTAGAKRRDRLPQHWSRRRAR